MKKTLAFTVFVLLVASCKHKSNPENQAFLEALESSTQVIEESNRFSMAGFEALYAENPDKAKKIYDFVQLMNTENIKLAMAIDADSVSSKSIQSLYENYKRKISSQLIFDIQPPVENAFYLNNIDEMKVMVKNRLATFNAKIFDEIHKSYSWCGRNWLTFYGSEAITRNDTTFVDLNIHFPAYKVSISSLGVQFNGDTITNAGTLEVNGKLGTLKFPNLNKGNYEVRGTLEFILENGGMFEEPFGCQFVVE